MKFNKLYPLLRWVTCFFTLAALLTPIILEAGRVYVRGYYRKNGTYVRPHYRISPDGIPWNNYSYPGNYNPNTGKIAAGDPNKYLKRYYSSPLYGGIPDSPYILSPSDHIIDKNSKFLDKRNWYITFGMKLIYQSELYYNERLDP
jgi:hypothetical protein